MIRRKLVFRPPSSVLRHPFLADLVVIARSLYPIPSRTRPSKSSAPMVLSLKAWKSRSLPGLPRTDASSRKVAFRFSDKMMRN